MMYINFNSLIAHLKIKINFNSFLPLNNLKNNFFLKKKLKKNIDDDLLDKNNSNSTARILNRKESIIKYKLKSKRKILIKYYLVFLFSLHYFYKNKLNFSSLNLNKFFFFTKKKKKLTFTLLRAPFRHKLTKKNYMINRYKHCLIIIFNYTSVFDKDIFILMKFFKFFLKSFSTNIIYQNNFSIKIPILL